MLAAVIKAKNAENVIKYVQKAKNADLIEVRVDYIRNLNEEDIKKIIKSCEKPSIITNRKKDEGGFFKGNEDERIGILESAINLGVDYIDIEYSSNKNTIKNLIKKKNKTKIIVSHHNFKKTPDNIVNIYNNIKQLNPDLIKIVTNANSVTDNFKIFNLIKTANKEKRKIIAFCMGSYGEFSRVLSIILGSKITYASIEKGKESATGQLTINEMANFYRIKKVNRNTKIVGLIGNPVKHSWSHIIHNAAFDKLNINAVYLKFRVDKLKEFIDYFKKLNICGFSVTIPHKIEIMGYLDKTDKKVKEIGAVNTIVVKSDRSKVSRKFKNKKFLSNKNLIGYTTDCEGAVQALKAKTKLKNKNVVLLGAGGSARALAYGLKEEDAKIIILNRTVEKAKSLVNRFDCNYGSLNDLKNIDYDILVNTTSVGMYPDVNNFLISPNLIKRGSIVFDIVFNPFKTQLLQDAERKGCAIIAGFEMLINGALLQFKLWTGKNAPEHLMRKKVLDYLE